MSLLFSISHVKHISVIVSVEVSRKVVGNVTIGYVVCYKKNQMIQVNFTNDINSCTELMV
jgi:hypothetical protein